MSKAIMKFTRSINRRKAIGGGLAAVFGAVAGVSLGQKAAVAAIPCSGLPDCRATSSAFCSGSNCASGTYHSCSPLNLGCISAGNYCWTSQGGKCCDCRCSWYGGGSGTVNCICYG